MFDTKERKLLEFLGLLGKLEPVDYVAVCKILKVELLDAEGGPLPFDVTLEAVIDRFVGMKKKPRNQLLKMLRQAIREGETDGLSTED